MKNISVKTKSCSGDGGGGFTKSYIESSDSDDNNSTSNDGSDEAVFGPVVSNDLMVVDDDPTIEMIRTKLAVLIHYHALVNQ